MTYKDNFIDKANKKFNFKFNYSNFEYINAKTKSVIICPEHGNFYQSPDKHLNSIHACLDCEKKYKIRVDKTGISLKNSRIPKEEYTKRFYTKFSNELYTLNLDNYEGLCGQSLSGVCKIHGDFVFNPRRIRGVKSPCILCSNKSRKETKTNSYSEILKPLKKKHNNRYIYSEENETIYINKRSKIKIICPEHGEYTKSAQKHLLGQGCFECKMIESIKSGNYLGGYSEIYFENNPDKKTELGTLYYIKIGNLYKIGITTNLNKRLRSLKSASKKTVDIVLSKECGLLEAFIVEQSILKENIENRTYRKWSTELFDTDILENIKIHFEE